MKSVFDLDKQTIVWNVKSSRKIFRTELWLQNLIITAI